MDAPPFNMRSVYGVPHWHTHRCSAGSVQQPQTLHQQVAGLQQQRALLQQQGDDLVRQRVQWLEEQNTLLQERVTTLEQGFKPACIECRAAAMPQG